MGLAEADFLKPLALDMAVGPAVAQHSVVQAIEQHSVARALEQATSSSQARAALLQVQVIKLPS